MSTSRFRTLQGVPNQKGTATILPESQTARLGRIRIQHPRGTFALTPASLISLTAICSHQDKLTGVGIDWGSGTGCLAIAAARVEAVRRVYGLEIDPANVKVAHINARLNAVQRKVSIFHADSYRPVSQLGQRRFKVLHGGVDFVLANPPSSEGDDGFAYRREVLRGGRLLPEIGRDSISEYLIAIWLGSDPPSSARGNRVQLSRFAQYHRTRPI